MRSNRLSILIGLVIMLSALVLVSGCSKHYVDVYINEQCYLTTLDGKDPIPVLFVHPGDHVIFNNTREDTVEINFPDGMFDTDRVEIPGRSRVTLKVISNDRIHDYLNIECPGGSSNPKAKVGEGP